MINGQFSSAIRSFWGDDLNKDDYHCIRGPGKMFCALWKHLLINLVAVENVIF